MFINVYNKTNDQNVWPNSNCIESVEEMNSAGDQPIPEGMRRFRIQYKSGRWHDVIGTRDEMVQILSWANDFTNRLE